MLPEMTVMQNWFLWRLWPSLTEGCWSPLGPFIISHHPPRFPRGPVDTGRHHRHHNRHHHHHFIEKPLKCNNSTREKIHFRNFSVPWCRRDLLSGQLGNLSLFSFVCFAPRLNLYPHTSQQAKPPGLEQNNEECGDKHSLSAPFSLKLFFTIFLTDFLLLWNILQTSFCLPEIWIFKMQMQMPLPCLCFCLAA